MGILLFKNIVMIDRFEKFFEEVQVVLDFYMISVNSGDKFLGNKDDQDSIGFGDIMRMIRVNGNIFNYENCDEDKLFLKDVCKILNFQGSIGFKI